MNTTGPAGEVKGKAAHEKERVSFCGKNAKQRGGKRKGHCSKKGNFTQDIRKRGGRKKDPRKEGNFPP